MKRDTKLCVDLKTIMQEDHVVVVGKSFHGVLTMENEWHLTFEESAKRTPSKPGTKIYNGKYISLIHSANNRYRCYLKTFTTADNLKSKRLAWDVFHELKEALTLVR